MFFFAESFVLDPKLKVGLPIYYPFNASPPPLPSSYTYHASAASLERLRPATGPSFKNTQSHFDSAYEYVHPPPSAYSFSVPTFRKTPVYLLLKNEASRDVLTFGQKLRTLAQAQVCYSLSHLTPTSYSPYTFDSLKLAPCMISD
jgi:hypothetical protein